MFSRLLSYKKHDYRTEAVLCNLICFLWKMDIVDISEYERTVDDKFIEECHQMNLRLQSRQTQYIEFEVGAF